MRHWGVRVLVSSEVSLIKAVSAVWASLTAAATSGTWMEVPSRKHQRSTSGSPVSRYDVWIEVSLVFGSPTTLGMKVLMGACLGGDFASGT